MTMTTSTPSTSPATSSADKPRRYKVIDGPLSVRKAPDGERTSDRLAQGAELEALSATVELNGYVWVQHSKGWSAVRTSDNGSAFMTDITDRPADGPRTFRVWASLVSVRDAPNGTRLPQKLTRGKEFSVVPASRTEAGGYIWWQHDEGWTAEASISGGEIFLKEVFGASSAAPPINPAERVTLPAHWQGVMNLQAAQATKVRNQPSIDPRGTIIITMTRGRLIEADMSTVTEADGYYWVRHALGWSAIMSIDGKTVFLAEPGTIPGLIYIGPDGPRAEELPGYRALVTRLPVNLNDTQWFQYFGNNMYAFMHGKAYGYDRYSQALHGGLDFGNSARAGVPVFAGVEGEFIKVEYPSKNNTRTFIKSGEYTLIYQHITNAQSFAPGQKIMPDTQLGNIEHRTINGGWDHLHFEVRYMTEWIVNPLLLLTPELYDSLIARFDPAKPNQNYAKIDSSLNFFYKTPSWTKWTTPLDQPMIKLNGPARGPRYEMTSAG
jgi:murein DD-endopeptidase MepM/ murein hydrolase activator NlpD